MSDDLRLFSSDYYRAQKAERELADRQAAWDRLQDENRRLKAELDKAGQGIVQLATKLNRTSEQRDALQVIVADLAATDPLVDSEVAISCQHCKADDLVTPGEVTHADTCPWQRARKAVGQ